MRRAALLALAVLALIAVLALGGSGGDRRLGPEPVVVTSYPIPHFRRGDAQIKRFGPLEFIGGLELRGKHRDFGGISGVRLTNDGKRFSAVTDAGDLIGGEIDYRNGAPAAMRDMIVRPLLVAGGRRAKDEGLWDIESLAFGGGGIFFGIERNHTILHVRLRSRSTEPLFGLPIPLPAFVKDWPENRGIEALGLLPADGPYAGRLIGISERSHGRDDSTEGFVMGTDGSDPFRFRLRRSDGFDVTDLDFLPSGDLVVLERFFSPLRCVAMRLRRVRTADIRPEAIVDGEVLMTADGGAHHVDNMEALSIHRSERGETIFTIVSDDNFSIAQRTLLLQFRLLGE